VTTDDQAAAHRAHLERLCADGGPLTANSRHATTQNPEWFNVKRQQPRQARRGLHNEILAAFVAAHADVLRNTGNRTYRNMPNPSRALQTHLPA
jgi:hypothetical protein